MGQSAGKTTKTDVHQADTAPPAQRPDDVVVDVCRVGDMKDGELREVDLGKSKALLVLSDGQFYSVGNRCSHLSGPLSKGVACNGKIRCPLHGACFSLSTGDIEEFPGLDGIPTFKVEIVNERVYVRAPLASLASHKRVKAMTSGCPDDDARVFLIIGGGPASITCAESLRQTGYNGRIVIAMMEDCLPYDRTKLSKAMTSHADAICLRTMDFYEKYGIEIANKKTATSVDFNVKVVHFADGASQTYDKLVLATGCRPVLLDVPGKDLGNVFTLRTVSNANAIADQSKDRNVVIIGSSFVGMELAMYFSDKARSVTVLVRSSAPFINALGHRIGTALLKLHETKGVKFRLHSTAQELQGEGGVVTGVKLQDGTLIPCDVCIQAIGVVPSTEFLKDSGIAMTDGGYIIVDEFMQTNIGDVYAAGDTVQFPLSTHDGQRVSIGHWQMAHHHGRVAGYNMVGQKYPLRSVPFFWTVMYGKSVRFAGHNAGFDDVIIHGDPDELKFAAFYTKGDRVVAASSLNYDPVVGQVAEMFAAGLTIAKDEIILSDPQSWVHRLPSP